MRGCLVVLVTMLGLGLFVAMCAPDEPPVTARFTAGARDAERFAAAISKAERIVKCEAYHAKRLVACIAEMDTRDIELFAGALVELSKEQGWQIDGRTLALDGWKWAMVNFDGEGIELDF